MVEGKREIEKGGLTIRRVAESIRQGRKTMAIILGNACNQPPWWKKSQSSQSKENSVPRRGFENRDAHFAMEAEHYIDNFEALKEGHTQVRTILMPLLTMEFMTPSGSQDFTASQILEAPLPRPSARHQWRPPEPDFVKVNFDAALFNHTNSAGIGVIARDWRGATLGALSMPTLLSSSVADMEALACLRAVQFAAELDLHRVIFKVTFSHVNRSGNIVVDALAKKASSNVGCQIWMDALPLDIAALVDFDVH
ncbi:hypothetical protein SO802_016036 [Lithocarpus litseifolius]|uniref:RNase H type-1 domain-containing protein n=1 Tax=Lithocarpus litseifolius TaxID=425828 RepID=A0AAW2CYP5_9ROSI